MNRVNFRKGVIPAGTVVWKKVRLYVGGSGCWNDNAIVKMIVLEDGIIPTEYRRAKASCFGRKCRIPKAYVVSAEPCNPQTSTDLHYKSDYKTWVNGVCAGVDYTPGTVVVPDHFDNNPKEVCRGGIHCFTTRQEAENYSL